MGGLLLKKMRLGDISAVDGVQIPPRLFWTNPGRFCLRFLKTLFPSWLQTYSKPASMSARYAVGLLSQKKMKKKIKKGAKEILISDEMSEEQIQKKIYEDMMNLAMHEAGNGWMRLGTLLSGSSTDQMLGAGFKALIDQNKIIIRQIENSFMRVRS